MNESKSQVVRYVSVALQMMEESLSPHRSHRLYPFPHEETLPVCVSQILQALNQPPLDLSHLFPLPVWVYQQYKVQVSIPQMHVCDGICYY